ncbi:MAG TPA: ATPase domain-containing protein [Verrucomicrobiaceae bacterium]|jgi:circadian clock protein KaiC
MKPRRSTTTSANKLAGAKARLQSGLEAPCSTGVPGLDLVLGGGLPGNRLYLIQGNPGVGKTTMALQFLLAGDKVGEKGLYITLSETREELEAIADSHGWDLSPIHLFELSTMEETLQGSADSTFFHPSEVELNRTITALLNEVRRVKPVRVVFDSLSEMRMLAEFPLRYRRQILQLKQFFAGRKCTVLLLDDQTGGSRDLQIESIAHGVLQLQRFSPDYGTSRRNLNIQKIRGVKFREGNHDFIIERGGIVLFPRLVAANHHVKFKREAFSSGNKQLDLLLGGGVDRGTSSMFMGPPGTGKSTMAAKFALEAARKSEKVLFFTFDETSAILLHRTAQVGMDLEPHVKKGVISMEQIDPAEISPGEMAHRVYDAVIRDGVRMVVIDSINGYLNAMPDERFLNLHLHELLGFLNNQGIITLMVLAQQGLIGNMQSTVDLTYLSDTVVVFRYFEVLGVVKQAMSVIKKRSGNHERTLREFTIDQEGFHISEPLRDMQGVFTGVPKLFKGMSEFSRK